MAPETSPGSVLWQCIRYTRFNLLVIAIGAFFLVGAGQGADIVLGLSRGIPQEIGLFFFGVSLWAWQSWFWARYILITRGLDRRRGVAEAVEGVAEAAPLSPGAQQVVAWYPRLLGLVAYLSAISILATTHGGSDWLTLTAVALATVYLLVVWKRTAIGRPRHQTGANWKGQGTLGLIVPVTVGFSLLTATVSGAFALADPVAYGFTVGSAPVLFLALASILPIGSLLVHITQAHRFPIVTVLAVLAVVSAFWVENHRVRSIGVDTLDRPEIWQVMTAFEDRFEGDRDTIVPAVFVATAGGGIRAAYWTARVLTEAEKAVRESGHPRPLSDHMVALSGVSGGSVGSAFYTAALADLGAVADKWPALDAAMTHDFLGPTLTGLMVQDLMQSAVPVTMFEGRGAILEQAFERAWARQVPDGIGSLARPLQEVGTTGDRWFPRLLLNGTNTVTGQRMIAGTLSLLDSNGEQVIVNALDQHAFLFPAKDGKPVTDLRLSTAAHNSARFPVVSPGGVLNNGGSAVVDGGYFENFGAATLFDLLTYIKMRRRGPERPHRILKPIIIQISSDPALGRQLSENAPPTEVNGALFTLFGRPFHNRLWNLIGAPVGGILTPRGARGVLAAQHLRLWDLDIGLGDDRARIDDPVWLHFRMDLPDRRVPGCEETIETEPPLGWVLSAEARASINEMIRCVEHNSTEMRKLVAAIRDAGGTVSRPVGPAAGVREAAAH
jgi:hypothetical protein